MAEQMIPSGMVPGLITVKKKDGTMQNLWPIDAKELLASGDAELVENGAVEASRINANPLRSGRISTQAEQTVAEITGIGGKVIVAEDAKAAEKAIKAGDSAEANDEPAVTSQNKSTPPATPKPADKASDKK